jgi:hypothetical protein
MIKFLLDLPFDIWDFFTYPFRLKKAWGAVDEAIWTYQERTGDENRFLVSIKHLQELFPEHKKDVMRVCWKRLRDEGRIFQDPLDSAWVLR